LAASTKLPNAVWKYVPANNENVMTSRKSALKRQMFVRREQIMYTKVRSARLT
jgi:hypothetical protein